MLLVVVAVEAEANALPAMPNTRVVVSGIGRTNAAVAVTRTVLSMEHCCCVLNVGVGGSLPGGSLSIGDVVYGTSAIYAEEGLCTPDGFIDIAGMGLSLGLDHGNAIVPDAACVAAASTVSAGVPIATVATCSGSDAQAKAIARRTNAAVEAMEGAAVLHAARLLNVPALEVRAISNTTGDRDTQVWDLPAAFASLGRVVPAVCLALKARF
jgi:futalosine hydrolase